MCSWSFYTLKTFLPLSNIELKEHFVDMWAHSSRLGLIIFFFSFSRCITGPFEIIYPLDWRLIFPILNCYDQNWSHGPILIVAIVSNLWRVLAELDYNLSDSLFTRPWMFEVCLQFKSNFKELQMIMIWFTKFPLTHRCLVYGLVKDIVIYVLFIFMFSFFAAYIHEWILLTIIKLLDLWVCYSWFCAMRHKHAKVIKCKMTSLEIVLQLSFFSLF